MAGVTTVIAFWVLVLACISAVHCQLYRGDICTDRGQVGMCKHIEDCPLAVEEIKKGINPRICSFEQYAPIVCCPGIVQRQPAENKTTEPGSKAAKMCELYSKYVYKYEKAPTLIPGSKPIKVDHCFQSSKPLIIGGEEAIPKEFPHMALVGFGEEDDIKWWCGGSLISPRFVLTAGHCLSSSSRGPARWVRVGDISATETSENAQPQQAAVVKRFAHPSYKPPAPYNDIALLELEKDLVLNEYVRPACIHTTFNIPEKDGIASGWGRTNWASSEGSEQLMKVSLPIQPTSACTAAYKSFLTSARLSQGIDEQTMICAGNLKGGKDTCKGDSGGPLQLLMTKPYCMYDIIGLTSFGKSTCGAPNSPAVYTRVSNYTSWIVGIVWP